MNLPVFEHSPLNRPYTAPYKMNVDMAAISDSYIYPNILRMSAVARTVPFYLTLWIEVFSTCALKQQKFDGEYISFTF